MTHEDCENYRELLAANALTALDGDDVRALTAHLESCSECRVEVSKWETTAALFALNAQWREPSVQVRERILASVRAEPLAQSFTGDRGERLVPSDSQAESNLMTFARPRRDVWASLRSFGAIAAALVFVALTVSLLVMWQQNRSTQNQLARAQAQLDHQRAMGELLNSPDGHMAKLAGTNMAPGAHAMLAYDKGGHAMLMARGLPATPKGMAYQLWYIKDNQKMPGKMLTIDAAGNGILEDQIPVVARDKAAFAITLEPEGGVRSPTGSVYLVSAS